MLYTQCVHITFYREIMGVVLAIYETGKLHVVLNTFKTVKVSKKMITLLCVPLSCRFFPELLDIWHTAPLVVFTKLHKTPCRRVLRVWYDEMHHEGRISPLFTLVTPFSDEGLSWVMKDSVKIVYSWERAHKLIGYLPNVLCSCRFLSTFHFDFLNILMKQMFLILILHMKTMAERLTWSYTEYLGWKHTHR